MPLTVGNSDGEAHYTPSIHDRNWGCGDCHGRSAGRGSQRAKKVRTGVPPRTRESMCLQLLR